ncbi:MAG: hypothetical protein WCR27_06850 [Eubacteriales bacterium]
MVRFSRVCRGQRTWHVWKEVSGTWETLIVPIEMSVGLTNRKRGKLMTYQGVGLTHSTLRSGELITWGRG